MARYEILGGAELSGSVTISGAKNAVVAILPAALLVNGPCRIENVPDISDVRILLDIMRSPLFMAYHDGQPFNDNMMRPCPMLENPEKLREIVEKSGARSTDMQSPETAEHLCSKCDSYAACWAPKAEELWEARKAQKVAQVGSKQ